MMVSDCYDPSAYGGLPSIALAVKEFNAMDGEAPRLWHLP